MPEESKAFVVISDTHLGLRAGKRLFFFKNTVAHMPIHVDQFLKWIEKLQSSDEIKLRVGGNETGTIEYRKFLFPDKLILNGDIFELWDASDQSIEFASRSILDSISRLGCEKLYLIGNHDFANVKLAEAEQEKAYSGSYSPKAKDPRPTWTELEKAYSSSYPWGSSALRIIRDTYPKPVDKKIETLRVGNDHYLFLHGHQFSQVFRWRLWKIISYLRDGAEAFRLYSWILVGLWIIWIIIIPLTLILQSPISPLIQYGIGVPLTILAVPRIFTSIARPIWNVFRGLRYRRDEAVRGFVAWWTKFTADKKIQAEKVHVIYGHTHTINIVTKNRLNEKINGPIPGPDFILINHPAWVKDTRCKHKNELQAAFVYADKDGFEFFGWNWIDSRPFHIPKSVIGIYASGKPIDKNTAKWLRDLEWPEPLVKEWEEEIGSKCPHDWLP